MLITSCPDSYMFFPLHGCLRMIITTCGLIIISLIFMYAFRMGLAISLVSEVPEKVWYHSNCPNRGKGCYNTTLLEQGGCAIWYNEKQVIQFFRIPLVEYGASEGYSLTIGVWRVFPYH